MRKKAPILVTAWRRKSVSKIINSISSYKPTKIYLACDGPIPNSKMQFDLVMETRKEIINSINWQCNIYKFFSEENKGLFRFNTEAISWFFENEEEGIILEDDNLPNPEFFNFCEILLERYRNVPRVFSIRGSNTIDYYPGEEVSYYFSKFIDTSGWASWRRAWTHYDPNIGLWDKFKKSKISNSVFETKKEREFYIWFIDRLLEKGVPDTWGQRWGIICRMQDALHIVPKYNLIKNLGLDGLGTNITQKYHSRNWKNINSKSNFPLKHPDFIIGDLLADRCFRETERNIKLKNILKDIFNSPITTLKKIIKNIFKIRHYF